MPSQTSDTYSQIGLFTIFIYNGNKIQTNANVFAISASTTTKDGLTSKAKI